MRSHRYARGIHDHREESMGWVQVLELRDDDGHRVVIDSFEKVSDTASR